MENTIRELTREIVDQVAVCVAEADGELEAQREQVSERCRQFREDAGERASKVRERIAEIRGERQDVLSTLEEANKAAITATMEGNDKAFRKAQDRATEAAARVTALDTLLRRLEESPVPFNESLLSCARDAGSREEEAWSGRRDLFRGLCEALEEAEKTLSKRRLELSRIAGQPFRSDVQALRAEADLLSTETALETLERMDQEAEIEERAERQRRELAEAEQRRKSAAVPEKPAEVIHSSGPDGDGWKRLNQETGEYERIPGRFASSR